MNLKEYRSISTLNHGEFFVGGDIATSGGIVEGGAQRPMLWCCLYRDAGSELCTCSVREMCARTRLRSLALVAQAGEHGNTTLNPVLRVFNRRNLRREDVVGRVTCRAERTGTSQCLVQWATVDSFDFLGAVDHRDQP